LRTTPQEEELVDFVSFVLDDIQRTWSELLPGYHDAKLVLFRDAAESSCGLGQSQMGPFYCPRDGKVYVDLSFYGDLRARFGAPGDFAQAYVLAHEIGHHVQNLTGTNGEVARLERGDPDRANELSVRLELQADCYAGVWAATVFAEDDLEPGDLDEAFTASEAVGDDRLQEGAGRRVDPDSFTHGTSEQRRTWFENGYESGDPAACDTFSPDAV
jgi:hypothetical protein